MTSSAATRPDPRLGAAVAAARITGAAIRRLGRGGGTAAPGLVADRIDPGLLGKIAGRLASGTVVVAGTNGKTTVSRMVADILESSGLAVAHNRSGSNMVRGVASALAERSTLGGDPRADAGVIESDEAALPDIVRQIRPRVLLLNNLFRDQLDRYGELATVANAWRNALAGLGPETTVVVNADDPTLASVTDGLRAHRICFGLDEFDPRLRLPSLPHAVDATVCRRCGHDLAYDALYSAHLGAWRCPSCGNVRPRLDVVGRDIVLDGVDALRLAVEISPIGEASRRLDLAIAVPGLYNAYNAVAAVAAASAFGIADEVVAGALSRFRSAFGRIERVSYKDRMLVLALVKNPVGFNETLR
ncbi:MAG TPA: Mur ligase family protein, partial [Thermomicrobiales bacterium]|nr:Mur ligase family protein [Thermomicrobiales bacterium]